MLRTVCFRLLLVATGLACGLSLLAQELTPASPSQQRGEANGNDSTLDRTLAALEANLVTYRQSVPSFLCNEHVASEMEPTPTPGGSLRMVTDSVFRVRRSSDASGQTTLKESRALKLVDGKTPTAAAAEETTQLSGPMAVFGIFSGGLDLVSLSAKACFRYRLHGTRKGRPVDKIVIDFEGLPVRERDAGCPYDQGITGRAYVQLASMRVTRIETKTHEHEVQPGVKETWEWSVDYAPVVLSGSDFWMPQTIRSKAIPEESTSGTGLSSSSAVGRRGGMTAGSPQPRPLTYTLEAKYTDYHLLHVVSRILLSPDAPGKTGQEPADDEEPKP